VARRLSQGIGEALHTIEEVVHQVAPAIEEVVQNAVHVHDIEEAAQHVAHAIQEVTHLAEHEQSHEEAKPKARNMSLQEKESVERREVAWTNLKSHAHETGQNKILLDEWHQETGKIGSRIRLAFLRSHSVLAPVLFTGNVGFTRAQTTMFLFNTLAVEIVVLSMQFETGEEEEAVKINPVVIFLEATLAAAICMPSSWLFAALFDPIEFYKLARTVCRSPCIMRDTLIESREKAAQLEVEKKEKVEAEKREKEKVEAEKREKEELKAQAPAAAPAEEQSSVAPVVVPAPEPEPEPAPSAPGLTREQWQDAKQQLSAGMGCGQACALRSECVAAAAFDEAAQRAAALRGKATVRELSMSELSAKEPQATPACLDPSASTSHVSARTYLKEVHVVSDSSSSKQLSTCTSSGAIDRLHAKYGERHRGAKKCNVVVREGACSSTSTQPGGRFEARGRIPGKHTKQPPAWPTPPPSPPSTETRDAAAENSPSEQAKETAATRSTTMTQALAAISSSSATPLPADCAPTRGGTSTLDKSKSAKWHGREFSNESLDILLSRSLRRQLRKRPMDKRQVAYICFGWCSNWFFFIALQLIFISYGCTFAGTGETGGEVEPAVTYTVYINNTAVNQTNGTAGADRAAEYLLTAWLISVGQRFLVAEPLVILFVFCTPICFASDTCGFLCGESINNIVSTGVAVFFRVLRG